MSDCLKEGNGKMYTKYVIKQSKSKGKHYDKLIVALLMIVHGEIKKHVYNQQCQIV